MREQIIKTLKGRTFKEEDPSLGIRSLPGKDNWKGEMGGDKIGGQFTLGFMSEWKDFNFHMRQAYWGI